MRRLLAGIIRLIFKIPFIRSKHFLVYERIIMPYNLFKGVQKRITRNGFELSLHINDWIQHNIYFLGGYEEAEIRLVKKHLNKGDCFVDIGANIGLFTLHASARVGDTGKVISFEPGLVNFTALHKHIELNGLQNVKTEKKAIGSHNGRASLYYHEGENNLGMASLQPLHEGSREEVDMVTLDSYFMENPCEKVDFVKIDVEGHEYDVLQGMKNTLAKSKPHLLIEILDEHPGTGESFSGKIPAFLLQLGYKKYFIADDGSISPEESNPRRKNFLFVYYGK